MKKFTNTIVENINKIVNEEMGINTSVENSANEVANEIENAIKTKGSKECEEGCLSFPNEFGKVIRPTEVTVEFYDRFGNFTKLKAKDLLAQAICHEVDHLNGIVFTDLVIPGTLEYVTPE